MARMYLTPLVGAGRFERPTPCAQGSSRMVSQLTEKQEKRNQRFMGLLVELC
jgi:hypothetical protein